MSSLKAKSYTIFPDWFSQKEFRFDGLINEMNGEMKNGQHIWFSRQFMMMIYIEEKRFFLQETFKIYKLDHFKSHFPTSCLLERVLSTST